jgi:hypothetical protein
VTVVVREPVTVVVVRPEPERLTVVRPAPQRVVVQGPARRVVARSVERVVVTGAGPRGVPGPEAAPYEHFQSSESADWIVNHNKGRKVVVTVLTEGLVDVTGGVEVVHPSLNQARVRPGTPQRGYALVL